MISVLLICRAQYLVADQSSGINSLPYFSKVEPLYHRLNNCLSGKTFLCVGPLCLQSGVRTYFVGVGCGFGIGAGIGFPVTGSGKTSLSIVQYWKNLSR